MKEYKLEAVVHIFELAELSEEERELIEAAKQATKGSYAPYSKFLVGAAARLKTLQPGEKQEHGCLFRGGQTIVCGYTG